MFQKVFSDFRTSMYIPKGLSRYPKMSSYSSMLRPMATFGPTYVDNGKSWRAGEVLDNFPIRLPNWRLGVEGVRRARQRNRRRSVGALLVEEKLSLVSYRVPAWHMSQARAPPARPRCCRCFHPVFALQHEPTFRSSFTSLLLGSGLVWRRFLGLGECNSITNFLSI